MIRRWRRVFRLLRLGLHLMVGALLVGLVYPLVSRKTRMVLRAYWCRRILHVLGVELRVDGFIPTEPRLIACNHISWLDVFVAGAIFPCWFVSKTEMRAWPFVGWMAAANDTLFLRRFSPRAAYRMNAEIRSRLAQGEWVAIFPEGTTTDGTTVLDFYPALFQPAIDTATPVLPVAISYRDERAHVATAVAYINDDPLWLSLRAVLEAPRTEAHLAFDVVFDAAASKRRLLAAQSCAAIRGLQSHHRGAVALDEARAEPGPAKQHGGMGTELASPASPD